ncbi:hypothetical protein HDK77DRAFT_487151 [Phyllosticta capitalensis]
MPGMAHLATLFDQLPGPHARRDALDAILGNLSSYEWRHLQDKLQLHSFAKDIIGSLPIELVALILSHLPPNAPFLYQTVSRRWRDVLSSSHVISSSLAQWYSDADPKLQGEIQGAVQDVYATQLLKAEHAWRFQQNRAFSFRRYNHPPLVLNWDDFNVDCVEDTICWLDPVERLIRLCNLRTGERTTIAGEARENILLLSLSANVVAFYTLSGCYVYDLQSRERTHFRLLRAGSSKTMAITAQGHIVAVAYYQYPRLEADVYLHFTQEHKTRHFLASAPAPSDGSEGLELTAVLLNKDRDMVTLFFMDAVAESNGDHNGLFCTSYSYGGQRLHNDSASRLDNKNSGTAFLKVPRAIDYTNREYVFEGCVDSDVDGRQATLLYFNNHQGCFTRQVTCRNSWKSFVSTIFKWKGMAFTLPWDKDLELFPPQPPHCEICGSHQLLESSSSEFGGAIALVGNESFLVCFAEDFCDVFCFDKHIQLPSDILSQERSPVQHP